MKIIPDFKIVTNQSVDKYVNKNSVVFTYKAVLNNFHGRIIPMSRHIPVNDLISIIEKFYRILKYRYEGHLDFDTVAYLTDYCQGSTDKMHYIKQIVSFLYIATYDLFGPENAFDTTYYKIENKYFEDSHKVLIQCFDSSFLNVKRNREFILKKLEELKALERAKEEEIIKKNEDIEVEKTPRRRARGRPRKSEKPDSGNEISTRKGRKPRIRSG